MSWQQGRLLLCDLFSCHNLNAGGAWFNVCCLFVLVPEKNDTEWNYVVQDHSQYPSIKVGPLDEIIGCWNYATNLLKINWLTCVKEPQALISFVNTRRLFSPIFHHNRMKNQRLKLLDSGTSPFQARLKQLESSSESNYLMSTSRASPENGYLYAIKLIAQVVSRNTSLHKIIFDWVS